LAVDLVSDISGGKHTGDAGLDCLPLEAGVNDRIAIVHLQFQCCLYRLAIAENIADSMVFNLIPVSGRWLGMEYFQGALVLSGSAPVNISPY